MIDQIYDMEGIRAESFTPSSSQGMGSYSMKSEDLASFLKEDKIYTIQELLEKSKLYNKIEKYLLGNQKFKQLERLTNP